MIPKNARRVTLAAGATTYQAIAQAIPAPADVAEGALVIVGAATAGTFGEKVMAVFGRKNVPRVLRCSALLAKGYVDIGAGVDDAGADLAWGYVPATGPC